MRTSEVYDSIYTKRPGWSVGHRDTTSDVLSSDLPTEGVKRPKHRYIFLATSIVVGAILIAFFTHSRLFAAVEDNTSMQGKSLQNTRSATVTINGQLQGLPTDGIVHRTYTTNSNKTTVDINIQDTSTAN